MPDLSLGLSRGRVHVTLSKLTELATRCRAYRPGLSYSTVKHHLAVIDHHYIAVRLNLCGAPA